MPSISFTLIYNFFLSSIMRSNVFYKSSFIFYSFIISIANLINFFESFLISVFKIFLLVSKSFPTLFLFLDIFLKISTFFFSKTFFSLSKTLSFFHYHKHFLSFILNVLFQIKKISMKTQHSLPLKKFLVFSNSFLYFSNLPLSITRTFSMSHICFKSLAIFNSEDLTCLSKTFLFVLNIFHILKSFYSTRYCFSLTLHFLLLKTLQNIL